LLIAEYGIDEANEIFTMDDVGNRSNVNLKDESDVNYVVDNLTNRYDRVGDANLAYDAARNLVVDKDAYGYKYDYENRIVEINDVNGATVAEFTYDALGRRIKKTDSVTSANSRLYYYNDRWQVTEQRDGSDVLDVYFIYGNYVDEVLVMVKGITRYAYCHDHLYNPVALVSLFGYSLSRDGIPWSKATYFPIRTKVKKWWKTMRTPLGLIPEGNNVYTIMFTAWKPGGRFHPIGMVRVKLKPPALAKQARTLSQ